MHTAADQSGTDLRSALGRAHDRADDLLANPEGSRLEVVAWLSAHIAAFEHSVYPVVRRRVPDGNLLVKEDREVVAQLAHTLRMMERRHSGDVLASRLSADRLGGRISALIAVHRKLQGRIVDALEHSLDDDAMSELTKAYEDSLAHAPTRPHPHLHSGVMFRLDALWDKVLDTMDGRHIPLPRVARQRIIPGRWGAYLLGQPHEPPAVPRAPRSSA
ncbi:MAG TPA: hypothetical protein VHA79_00875 [Mycobacteriales bacterium]|nr:hypothetical protein [Mycobacteriales bacterium]